MFCNFFRLASLIILFGIFTGTNSLSGQTNISGGYVSGCWEQANSPYIVNGDITVRSTKALTIEPGVQILFSGHYSFTIKGKLLAVGTLSDTIIFSVSDTSGFSTGAHIGWLGLKFSNTNFNGQDSLKLSFCKIQYGKVDQIGNNSGGAMHLLNSSNIGINNCLIKNNFAEDGGGIYCSVSSPNISNTEINYNKSVKGGGAYLTGNSNAVFNNVYIYRNYLEKPQIASQTLGAGIYCENSSPQNYQKCD